MRRAQSVRTTAARPTALTGIDDLGQLREAEESVEVTLRRQLLDKDRETDKLQTQLQVMQVQLAQRPPIETIQQLEKEYKNLELILQGTQRENERCMAELERAKAREKMLERELAKLAGENWQSSLDIPMNAAPTTGTRSGFFQRMNAFTSGSVPSAEDAEAHQQATQAHLEEIRLVVLGMEQRLQVREEKLLKNVERAESETRKFDQLRKEIVLDS